jgi:hypothetical protein
MIQDVRSRCAASGSWVDAIFIGGDIAYRADPVEYGAADRWIDDLIASCGCSLEKVYVVPGNHDVDRGIIKRHRNIQNAQAMIAGAPAAQRAGELRAQLTDEAVGHAVFEPLAAYNEFAKRFDCQVYPTHLLWKQDISLRHDVTLRLHGVTSTLLSGAVGNPDQNDTRDSLYLSPWQTVFDPADNVVNAVMSHHPPDWFMDHEAVEAAVRGRTALHFFGHRHTQGNVRDPQYMRFEAGALNPDPNELSWHPAYNIIDLKVEGEGEHRRLHIDTQFMSWQAGQPERYIRLVSSEDTEIWHHEIRIPAPVGLPPVHQATPVTATVTTSLPAVVAVDPGSVVMSEQSKRRIVTRWWRLPMDARREIALKLQLIVEAEIELPEPERYGLALMRAGERGKIAELTQEIEKWETQ